jgi:hypothetical protein
MYGCVKAHQQTLENKGFVQKRSFLKCVGFVDFLTEHFSQTPQIKHWHMTAVLENRI